MGKIGLVRLRRYITKQQCANNVLRFLENVVALVTELGISLQWRHNEHNDVSNDRRIGCLLNRLFMRRSKKTSNSASLASVREFTGDQRASGAENVSIWWRHRVIITCEAIVLVDPLCIATLAAYCALSTKVYLLLNTSTVIITCFPVQFGTCGVVFNTHDYTNRLSGIVKKSSVVTL